MADVDGMHGDPGDLSAHQQQKTEEKGLSAAGTHIHDLTEDCLITILSLVGTQDEELPIRRQVYHDVAITHPLQCALVCKRWQSCAPAAVRSLKFPRRYAVSEGLKRANAFSGVRRLCLDGGVSRDIPANGIASAFPGLECLEVNSFSRNSIDLTSWTQLKELGIRLEPHYASSNSFSALLDILSRMTTVESLRVDFYGSEPDDGLWDELRLRMPQLRKLDLPGVPPPSMAAVPALLSLTSLRLATLPPHLLLFRNITNCSLSGFQGEELPAGLGFISSLESLAITDASSLATLPSSLVSLPLLKVLALRDCWRLACLPPNFGQLPKLEVLQLRNCGLLELSDTLGHLARLTELSLKSLGALRVLPDSIGDLSRLQKLSLKFLPSVEDLPESLGRLTSVKELELHYLSGLQALPASMGNLCALRHMVLSDLHSLGCLPDSIGQLEGLESLDLSLRRMVDLPESMDKLKSLKKLRLKECARLEQLPVEFTRLSNLRELEIEYCESFCDHMDVIPKLGNLRFLRIVSCPRQPRLPVGLETFTAKTFYV